MPICWRDDSVMSPVDGDVGGDGDRLNMDRGISLFSSDSVKSINGADEDEDERGVGACTCEPEPRWPRADGIGMGMGMGIDMGLTERD